MFDAVLDDIRFIASVRLVVAGEVMGSLCLLDTVPRGDFGTDIQLNLEDCADMILATIERKSNLSEAWSPRAAVSAAKNAWSADSVCLPLSLDNSVSERSSTSRSAASARSERPEVNTNRNDRNSFREGSEKILTGSSSVNPEQSSTTLVDFDAPNAAVYTNYDKHPKIKKVLGEAPHPVIAVTQDAVQLSVDSANGDENVEAPVLSFRYSISGNFAHNRQPSGGGAVTPSSADPKQASRFTGDRIPAVPPSQSSSANSFFPRSHSPHDDRGSNYSSGHSMSSYDSENEEPSVIVRNHMKVLLMEDSVLVQKILRNQFQQQGCEVVIAKNGKIGLELLIEEDFDIAFIDFFMPIQDGVTTMKLFKEYLVEMRAKPDYMNGSIFNDELIIVGISDIASDVDKSEARFNDMDIFCSKPLDPEIVKTILSARKNCSSFAIAVEQITREIDTQMKSKLALVTALGEERAERESKPAAPKTAPPKDLVRAKPIKKRTAQPKSWWRTLTSFYSPPSPTPATTTETPKQSQQKTSPVKRAPPAVNYQMHLNGVDPNRIKVIIMDDSPAIVKILSNTFKKNGCDVSTARNGTIGLEMLKTEEFDIALVDFHMPVMDGITAMQEFNEWILSERAWLEKGYPGSAAAALASASASTSTSASTSSTAANKKKGAVKNENMILIGMSDSITRTENEHVFDENSMHFFCGKPVSQDLLLIILKAAKNYDNVDDMLVYIERNATKLFSEQHQPVYNWAKEKMKNMTIESDRKVKPL